MRLVGTKEYNKLQSLEEDLKESKRTHSKVLRETKHSHSEEVTKINQQKRTLELKVESLEAENKALNGLRDDAVATKTLSLELEEREKTVKQKEDNVKVREDEAELEDSKKYKSGYEDGVADGLRKGYELTADDRQNMATIAALAAASHSDGATKAIAEEVVVGMQKRRNALPAKTKD